MLLLVLLILDVEEAICKCRGLEVAAASAFTRLAVGHVRLGMLALNAAGSSQCGPWRRVRLALLTACRKTHACLMVSLAGPGAISAISFQVTVGRKIVVELLQCRQSDHLLPLHVAGVSRCNVATRSTPEMLQEMIGWWSS